MVDFGLAKPFIDADTGRHIPYSENRSICGTLRYISLNVHKVSNWIENLNRFYKHYKFLVEFIFRNIINKTFVEQLLHGNSKNVVTELLTIIAAIDTINLYVNMK